MGGVPKPGGLGNPPIPETIHQIWFGPEPVPTAWTDTWRDAHPAWGYHVWRESDVEGFGLRNEPLWGDLIRRHIYDAASDVARVEILYRMGGVYIDADSVCLRPLGGAYFLGSRFFATREIRPDGTSFVTNAFMGSVPGHPILARYIERLGEHRRIGCRHGQFGSKFCCAWEITGPMTLSALVRGTDATILPPSAFFRTTITGRRLSGKGWGQHFWSSTVARSPEGTFVGKTYGEAV